MVRGPGQQKCDIPARLGIVALNLSDLKEERIAWREQSRKGNPIYPEPPTWSPDGKHLIVCLGEDADYSTPSLLLDFPRHEFIVVPMLLHSADLGIYSETVSRKIGGFGTARISEKGYNATRMGYQNHVGRPVGVGLVGV